VSIGNTHTHKCNQSYKLLQTTINRVSDRIKWTRFHTASHYMLFCVNTNDGKNERKFLDFVVFLVSSGKLIFSCISINRQTLKVILYTRHPINEQNQLTLEGFFPQDCRVQVYMACNTIRSKARHFVRCILWRERLITYCHILRWLTVVTLLQDPFLHALTRQKEI
jgi:hypothetical protein